MISVGIAAGGVKYPHQVGPLLRLPTEALSSITLGSYTLEPREGNTGGTNFWTGDTGESLNSLGMPNPGIKAASEFLGDVVQDIRRAGKVSRISIAGFSADEYARLAEYAVRLRFQDIELNLGCPNIRDGGTQKRIASFDPEMIADILDQVSTVTDHVGAGRIAVKLSPYSDPYLLKEVAALINERAIVDEVVCCNTFPNASGYDLAGKPLISVADGYAGLAGTALSHIALGQARQFREKRRNSLRIVGVGGVRFGQNVRDFELAGADSVQIGTAFFENEDPRIFQQILEDYAALAA